MPTYVTLKDVKKRWGHGQEDVFPVCQFEKLWGDMTALPGRRLRLRRGVRACAASSSRTRPSSTAGSATARPRMSPRSATSAGGNLTGLVQNPTTKGTKGATFCRYGTGHPCWSKSDQSRDWRSHPVDSAETRLDSENRTMPLDSPATASNPFRNRPVCGTILARTRAFASGLFVIVSAFGSNSIVLRSRVLMFARWQMPAEMCPTAAGACGFSPFEHRVDEVLVVRRQIDPARHLLDRLVPLAVQLPADAVADDRASPSCRRTRSRSRSPPARRATRCAARR